jgi:hypothetical protein
MYIMNLTSAQLSALNLLRAMKFGSLTMALSRLLATAGLRTMLTEGVLPGQALMSFSLKFKLTPGRIHVDDGN